MENLLTDPPSEGPPLQHAAPLVVEDLTAGYGDKTVITGLSFSLREGETLALVGSSGCGKSTVLKCLVGLLRPQGGSVRLLGEDLWSMAVEERRKLLRRVGLIFQAGALLGSLSVEDNLALPLEMHTNVPAPTIKRLVKARLAQVGLAKAAPLKPSELSGGMRKRVAIARSLMMDPHLLLCDEPTSGLDPVVAASIDELLAEAKRLGGSSLVLVSHDLASIQRLSDRIIMLADGKEAARGTFEELSADQTPAVRAFFQREPRTSGYEGPSMAEQFLTQLPRR